MPRVPVYDSPQVSPTTVPQVRLATPSFAAPTFRGADAPAFQDTANPQALQFSQAARQFGHDVGRIADSMLQQANQVRIADASNRGEEAALRLKHDKDIGFLNLKGINALERPDGKPLEDEYAEKLKQELDEIAASLGNDTQRQAFALRANEILTKFRGQAIQHEAQEHQTYKLSVSEGVQATALRDIALNWNNPEAIDSAVGRIEAEVFRQGQLLGKSAEWQHAQARKLTSYAHKTALMAALENNDPVYADAYLNKYSGQMEANDILAVRGHITKEMDLQIASTAVDSVLQKFEPRIHTSDAERAFHIAVGTESNHQQFDAQGNPLTSSKGAIGIAQLMPGTAPEAAKLAGLPWDEHQYKTDPAYNKALGMAYFQKQLQDFGGNLAQTYAAYNAGPQAVRDFRDGTNKSGKNPEKITTPDGIPPFEETRNYVNKNMREFAAGKGKATPPSLSEMQAELHSDPSVANSPSRLKHAETKLETEYKSKQAERKQAEDQATDAVLRELYANGGSLDAVPAALRAQLPGDKLGMVMDFADKVAKSGRVHDPEAWAGILSLPDEHWANMAELDFYHQFRPVLDDAHLEKGYALIRKASGTATDKHLEIISVDSRLRDAALRAGLLPEFGRPNKDQQQRFAQLKRAVDERVRRFEQSDLGGKRKANGEELQRILDATLLDKAKVSEGGLDPTLLTAVMTPDELSNAYVEVEGDEVKLTDIPTSQRALIASKLQARGMAISEQRIAELWVAAGRPQ